MTGSVICFVILCFILTLASFVRSQGYNGCKSKEWHYHDHTHSCFRHFRYNYNWDDSKRYCQRYWGTPDYNRNGILARIDDEETNTFVKGLLKTSDEAWIGLKGRGQGSAFRWQGYPNEEPSFLKFASAPQTKSEVSTVITSSFWKTLQPGSRRHSICQVKAEILRTKITCPPAIKQNHNLNQPVTCEFYFNHWKSVTWFNDTTELATCSNETSSCSNRDQRSEASLRGKKTSLSYHGIIKRQFGLKCRIISTDDKVLVTKTCDLQVYEPPNTISCTLELARDKLQVVCKTAKIYPEASCKWFYKNQNDTSFRAVSLSEARIQTHEEFYDGDKYFRSQCNVNLTKWGTDFKVGLMSVKVIMYPTVKESDLSTVQDASAEYQQGVFIELPRQPMFTVNGTPYTESVSICEGDVITVKCEIKSGRPSVYTTTMSCEFPIMSSERHIDTWKGTSYLINNKKAEGNMDGKSCSCWGNHITGNSEKSTLKFKVSCGNKVVTNQPHTRSATQPIPTTTPADAIRTSPEAIVNPRSTSEKPARSLSTKATKPGDRAIVWHALSMSVGVVVGIICTAMVFFILVKCKPHIWKKKQRQKHRGNTSGHLQMSEGIPIQDLEGDGYEVPRQLKPNQLRKQSEGLGGQGEDVYDIIKDE